MTNLTKLIRLIRLIILTIFTFIMGVISSCYSIMAIETALYSPFKQELIEKITTLSGNNITTKQRILSQLKDELWINSTSNYEKTGDFDINHLSKVIIGTISDRNVHTKSIFNKKSPIGCEHVKSAYDNSIYFYERVKNIGDELQNLYEKMSKVSRPDSVLEKKAKTLEAELQKVAKLLIQTYPPSFGEVDRILTYEWEFPSLEEAFKANAIDIDKITIDQIRVFNSVIDTRKNHDFVSLPFEKPYFQEGKIFLEFKLTPAEACLQNLSVELEGNLFLTDNSESDFDWSNTVIITGGDLPIPSFIPKELGDRNPWKGLPDLGSWPPVDSDDWCGTTPRPFPTRPEYPRPGHWPNPPAGNDFGNDSSMPKPFPFPFPPGFGGGFHGFSGSLFSVKMAQTSASASASISRKRSQDNLQEWKLYLRAYTDMSAE